jgi:hypothetical protein
VEAAMSLSVQALFDILLAFSNIVLALAVINLTRRVHHLTQRARLNTLRDAALFEIAKTACLSNGVPWTDPRTGITFRPMDDEGER